jgi:hypothetical protein
MDVVGGQLNASKGTAVPMAVGTAAVVNTLARDKHPRKNCSYCEDMVNRHKG